MVVDTHHHLWHFDQAEYGWIDAAMVELRRDFLPQELAAEMAAAGVRKTVAVQARQSVEETRWLLEQAQANDFIAGVVGWLPLASAGFADALAQFAGETKLKGLRHVVQEEATGFLLGSAFNAGIAAMQGSGLIYDLLIYAPQLEETIAFVDRHPRQRFVLDHIAKPPIGAGMSVTNPLEPWAGQMRELARRENVWCKVSGVVTEADRLWTTETLRPYLDVVVESFGPRRLMVGSDWPVCLMRVGYARWFDLLREYFGAFAAEERDAIFAETAVSVYRL